MMEGGIGMIRHDVFDTPLGTFLALAEGEALTDLHRRRGKGDFPVREEGCREEGFPLFRELRRQLEAYAAGELRAFDLPLAPRGTPFRRAVWEILRGIPYGETLSYGELARRAGRPGAGRAVGGAMGANPILLIQPCHRVIGSDGTLRGFGAGVDLKAALLAFEARILRGGGGAFGTGPREEAFRRA